MKYVFGPVPSRRLGSSLGVDPVPLKSCNWNCVYCQLGRSVPMTNERMEYIPRQIIVDEVVAAYEALPPGAVDWITFVGSGEPTLHSGLGWMIRELKRRVDAPPAVCTNGALLYRPEVRWELLAADLVMPTVAAGSKSVYRRLHRPMYALSYERYVSGLIDFRRQYRGLLWAEVMLVAGVNDDEQALLDLAQLMGQVNPERIHIMTPTRPPAETWARAPQASDLQRAAQILSDVAEVTPQGPEVFPLGCSEELEEAILAILERHPMRQEEVTATLREWAPERAEQIMGSLLDSGRVQMVERNGVAYWSGAGSRFPDEAASRAVSPEKLAARHPSLGQK